jgi:ATP-binding cassette subfamily B protein
MLVGPMFDIGNLFVLGRRAQAGSERVGEMEQHPAEVEPQPGKEPFPSPGDLRLENVTFAYGTGLGHDPKSPADFGHVPAEPASAKPALKGVTMDFPRGSRTGIAGTVGSGKSTIFRLLFRLADPQQGKVTLQGTDVRSLDAVRYRALFGYAPQEATLFSDTLRENVSFGQGAGDQELGRVISLAQLGEDIKDFTKGLDEKLGGRGARLSGGQKERVAIARALVNRPPILVFDDATSALDAETEKELVRRLDEETGSSTVIIVSHRLSILSGCDRVYVLDAGEVIEQGTHEELLAKQGLYWKLYQRQLIQEELEKL